MRGPGRQVFDAVRKLCRMQGGIVLVIACVPGNVRELRNGIERAMVLSRGVTIGVDDLPKGLRGVAWEDWGDGPEDDGDKNLRGELAL